MSLHDNSDWKLMRLKTAEATESWFDWKLLEETENQSDWKIPESDWNLLLECPSAGSNLWNMLLLECHVLGKPEALTWPVSAGAARAAWCRHRPQFILANTTSWQRVKIFSNFQHFHSLFLFLTVIIKTLLHTIDNFLCWNTGTLLVTSHHRIKMLNSNNYHILSPSHTFPFNALNTTREGESTLISCCCLHYCIYMNMNMKSLTEKKYWIVTICSNIRSNFSFFGLVWKMFEHC